MTFENNWQNKTLENLEKDVWDESDIYPSTSVKRCFNLRKKYLGDFSIEDLRIMIGQEIGLRYLMPLAIEKLKVDLLAEGDYYPGDLLNSVLCVSSDFWNANRNLWAAIDVLINSKLDHLKTDGIKPEKFYSFFK